MQCLEGIKDAVGSSVFEWLGQDGITVTVRKDHDVVVAGAGWGMEFPVWSV